MLLMRLEHQIRVILVMVLVISASYTQSLLSFVGEWDGTESLTSPIGPIIISPLIRLHTRSFSCGDSLHHWAFLVAKN